MRRACVGSLVTLIRGTLLTGLRPGRSSLLASFCCARLGAIISWRTSPGPRSVPVTAGGRFTSSSGSLSGGFAAFAAFSALLTFAAFTTASLIGNINSRLARIGFRIGIGLALGFTVGSAIACRVLPGAAFTGLPLGTFIGNRFTLSASFSFLAGLRLVALRLGAGFGCFTFSIGFSGAVFGF